MDRIKIYKPPEGPAQAADFIEGLEPKLRDKVVRQIFYLSRTPLPELKEPHYKHFSIEKYQSLYELREKGRVVVWVIFTPCPNRDYLLLHAFGQFFSFAALRTYFTSLIARGIAVTRPARIETMSCRQCSIFVVLDFIEICQNSFNFTYALFVIYKRLVL